MRILLNYINYGHTVYMIKTLLIMISLFLFELFSIRIQIPYSPPPKKKKNLDTLLT